MADKESTLPDKNESIIPPRENLIAIALTFLNNPKVQASPMSQKIAFLKKKGLTEEEINIAIHRVYEKTCALVNNESNAILVPKQNPFWFPMTHFTSSCILISLALYGIHYVYKVYIEPWIFGKKSTINRLSYIEEKLLEVNSQLSLVKSSISNLEQTIEFQKLALDKLSTREADLYMTGPLVLNDIKSEISSLKSILLSRHQFPAAPKLSATIPSWQLNDSEVKSSEYSMENNSPESSQEHCLDNDSQENSSDIKDKSITNNQNDSLLPNAHQSEDELAEETASNSNVNLNGEVDAISKTVKAE